MSKSIAHAVLLTALIFSATVCFSQSTSGKTLMEPTEALQNQGASSQQFENLARIWEAQVNADRSNADAWLNWFEAERFSHFQRKMKIRNEREYQRLQEIVLEMSANIPNSAELDYARFLLNPFTDASFEHIERAYQKNASGEVQLDYIAFLKIRKERNLLQEKLADLQNKELFSAKVMEYNRNVLVSVPKNGILITHGNSDTFPILIWQEAEGFRTDVEVINIEWLNNEQLRTEILERLEIVATPNASTNVYSFVNQLLTPQIDQPIALALTLPPVFLQQHQNRLNCAGLVFVNQKDFAPKDLMKNWFDFELFRLTDAEGINANYQLPLYLLDQYLAEEGPERKRNDLLQYKALFPNLFKDGQ